MATRPTVPSTVAGSTATAGTAAAARRKQKNTPVMAKATSLTLLQIVHAYLDDLQVRNYKPKTILGYRKNLTTFTHWAESQGTQTLAGFDSELVKGYIRYLQHKTKWSERTYAVRTQERLKPTAIRNYVRDLKTFASWLAQEGYTRVNMLEAVRLPKVDETPSEPFRDDELDRIFGALDTTDAHDLRDYVLLHTLWDTGMRVGELVALTTADVDLKSCQIRIQHAKFGKWHDIGFGNETHKYIRPLYGAMPTPAGDPGRSASLPFARWLPAHGTSG